MKTRHLLALATTLLLPGALLAQQVAQPPLATTSTISPPAPDAGDIVQLDVFNVTGEGDQGYSARDTTSGSRVRTALKDTAASIQVFTDEFLRDIGAQSIDEMLNYAGNAEEDLDDLTDGGGTLDTRTAGAGSSFRIRGISASLSVDGAQNGAPVDLYNVDRAEVASGANSILFGMDSQGGTVNLSTMSANLNRNTLKVQATLGTWTSPAVRGIPYQRLTYNYNIVLIPKKWAVGLSGVFQDGGQNSWRYWMGYHQKRINPVTTIKPFPNTTIRLGYEKGQISDATTTRWNCTDGITGYLYWLANDPNAGDGILKQNTTGGVFVPPAMTLYDPVNDLNYQMSPVVGGGYTFTYVSNNDTMYNLQGAYRSNYIMPTGRTNIGQYRLPAHLSSYYYSTLGPSGTRTNNFDRYNINIQQRIGDVTLEFFYNRNRNKSTAYGNGANEPFLYADPNPTITPITYVSAADSMPNPFAGRYFMQCGWMKTVLNQTNNLYRLTGEYTLNLKNWGRHRFVGLLEHTENDTFRDRLTEVLLDDDQYAYNYGAPDDSGNGLGRRNYVTWGDFSTYFMGEVSKPLTGIHIGSRVFHSAFATIKHQNGHVKGNTNGASLALQDYMFKDSLVTTLGLRVDRATYKVEDFSRCEPGDPAVLNGTKAVNELRLNGVWTPRPTVIPYTLTAGAVWHAIKHVSLTGNYSTNRGQPRQDGRTVLPTGDIPSPTRGTTFDYGVTFDLAGDYKTLVLIVTKFATRQYNDASIGGIDGDASAVIGGDGAGSNNLGSVNLFNIMDALYFLAPTAAVGNCTYLPGGAWPTLNGTITGPGKGPLSAAQYAATAPTELYPYGHPPVYTAGSADTASDGYEFTLTSQPTNSITLRFTFTYTKRQRTALLPEIFDYFNTNIPKWLEMAARNNPDTHAPYMVVDATGNAPVATPLLEYVRKQLYGNGGARDGINTELFNASTILGQRPYNIRFTGKYAFQDGLLKGLSLGASARYRSPNLMIDPYNRSVAAALAQPPASATDLYIDPSMYYGTRNTMRGNSLTSIDPFASYKCKLFGGRANLTLQLNIYNLMDQGVVTVSAMTVDSIPRRTYINPPRTYRLTATIDF